MTEDNNCINQTLEKPDSTKRTGVCAIKPEFILEDNVRTQSGNKVNDKDSFESETKSNEENLSSEPPAKKQKKDKPRGQNKNRSVPFKALREHNLCPWIAEATVENSEKKCTNEKCTFIHDRAEYLKIKPADISSVCISFETTGRCQRGLACRVGSKHITADGFNIIDKEKYEAYKKLPPATKNVIDRDLLENLRKYRYDFSKAETIIKKHNPKWKETHTKSNKSTNCDASVVEKESIEIRTLPAKSEQNIVPEIKCDTIRAENPIEMKPESVPMESEQDIGPILNTDVIKIRSSEKKTIDWRDKLMLAPLTTVGNLPFRRICKEFGADITCGEMALSPRLLKGALEEWALVKRHASEDLYGVQIAGNNAGVIARCSQFLNDEMEVDFVDLNLGCPIDFIYKQGSGCGMMNRLNVLEHVVKSASEVLDIPFTVKTRTGVYMDKPTAHTLMPKFREWGASMINIHGRSREQRYTKLADWDYIERCAQAAVPIPVYGTGDILSYDDYARCRLECPTVQGVSIARGALIKPWIFQEIKEKRTIDISATERFDIMKRFTNYGLEHWGSDTRGVETTRRFLLEWISFLYRYIPVGILENPPQKMNNRPPYYKGRNDLETMMASSNCADWIKLSEMLLGKVPDGFKFLPKHKANAWN
ncbi:tRNA-dihydrouridine(47) synthase [NAD(P)(+)]-like [Trichogramma pretiosum]|uniref:tRNA-dihydrouridine(47) synthase [NAD(P)(+)]-like n=1 Tax=Trichogramma pretiosum TaxID=7493 RepID=UPI0006C9AFBF|nr:tRNA-dihydrouridine(47) synthase [NAD(P)(+)]-like [Trichogramma pretiosum]